MFKCKVCIEKEKRIEDLQKQLNLLYSIAFPSQLSNQQAFLQSLEVNKVLGGETDQVQVSPIQPTAANDFDVSWT